MADSVFRSVDGGRRTIFVRGFDIGTPEEAVRDHFSACGTIDSLTLGYGSWTNCATITYSCSTAAEEAVKSLHQTTIDGNMRFVEVKFDEGPTNTKARARAARAAAARCSERDVAPLSAAPGVQKRSAQAQEHPEYAAEGYRSVRARLLACLPAPRPTKAPHLRNPCNVA
eukprot:TRINITY_DN67622_c0_g1_i1.p1 TRINITY_DN67622_c0_g1~~TRINITY_DN67622_c0_g1_i1.p1  ORF type:complete len:170 (+),score=28.30 TRINITY_DN67622_c0_g1_i1:58-567(+)